MFIHFSATASHPSILVTSKDSSESYSGPGRYSDVKSDDSRTEVSKLGKSEGWTDVEERVRTGARMASSLTDDTEIRGPFLPSSMPSSIPGNTAQSQVTDETTAVLDEGKEEQLSEGMKAVLPDLEALGVTDAQGRLKKTELMRSQELAEKILQKRKRKK